MNGGPAYGWNPRLLYLLCFLPEIVDEFAQYIRSYHPIKPMLTNFRLYGA